MFACDFIFQTAIQNILEFGSKVTTRNDEVLRLTNEIYSFRETPLVSIRRTAWKSALREMEWFLSGSNNIGTLHPTVHKWWKPWINLAGEVAYNYSRQLRKFMGYNGAVDQIQLLIDGITNHPYSRRNVITTWNTSDMVHAPITNCHGTLIQCFVNPEDNTLDMTMCQRSADMMLGVPHNWIQYWAFLLWLAHRTGREVGQLTWFGTDCHIYTPHLDMAKRVVNTKLDLTESPELIYTPTSEDFKAEDFTLSAPYKVIIDEKLEMVV